MANNPMYAMIIFRQSDTDLYHWYQRVDYPRVSRTQIGREAFECLRLFDGSLAQAQEAAAALNFMRERYGQDWQKELVK